jgi:hypothetical protein
MADIALNDLLDMQILRSAVFPSPLPPILRANLAKLLIVNREFIQDNERSSPFSWEIDKISAKQMQAKPFHV